MIPQMHSPTDHGDLLSEISSLRLDNGGKDTGGKGTGMDPRVSPHPYITDLYS